MQSLFQQALIKQPNPSHTLHHYTQLWNSFTRWTLSQLDIQRSVTLGTFAVARLNNQLVQTVFLESFLLFHSFTQHQQLLYSSPLVKINYIWLAKSLNQDRTLVIQILNSIFEELQYTIIHSKKPLTLDLDIFGTLNIDVNNHITVVPKPPPKTQPLILKQNIQPMKSNLNMSYNLPRLRSTS